MSDIVKSEGSPMSHLQQQAVEACAKPRIRVLKLSDMTAPVVGFLKKAHQTFGSTSNEEDDIILGGDIIRELKRSFPYLSLQEVGIAIDLGSKGLLKTRDVVHVTARHVIMWVKAYTEEVRAEALEIHKKKEREKELEKEKEEELRKMQIFEEFIQVAFEEFCEGALEHPDMVLAAMYRHCVKKLGEQLPLEEKKAIYKQAEEIYMADLAQQPEEQSFLDRAKRRNRDPDEVNLLQKSEIKAKAEAEGMRKVFEKWKDSNYDLKESFNNK